MAISRRVGHGKSLICGDGHLPKGPSSVNIVRLKHRQKLLASASSSVSLSATEPPVRGDRS